MGIFHNDPNLILAFAYNIDIVENNTMDINTTFNDFQRSGRSILDSNLAKEKLNTWISPQKTNTDTD